MHSVHHIESDVRRDLSVRFTSIDHTTHRRALEKGCSLSHEYNNKGSSRCPVWCSTRHETQLPVRKNLRKIAQEAVSF